jgi:2-polyprenyl-3-methyl-5-hydroxy-6-metoxy-1,4-benzoquinol methylase
MQHWFKAWFNSPYYHRLYKHRTEEEAKQFVDALVTTLQWKPSFTLLELACGKGRHAQAFAQHQLDVTGIDLAEDSILYAKQWEKDNLHFYVHDMRQIFRTNYYDVVTNMFTSFGYFDSAHENQLAAKTIYLALKPGGMFLMDFVNQQYAFDQIAQHPNHQVMDEGVQFDITKSIEGKRVLKEIAITEGSHKEVHTEELETFSFQEMKELFTETGLHFRKAFGSYTLEDYQEGSSQRMILLFEK